MDPDQQKRQAKDYTLRLIKFRLRSEKEIRDKLLGREFEPEIIDTVVESLKKAKLVDDALFARLWVESRIKRSLGLARLAYELKQKGIAKNLIESAIGRIKEGYDEEQVIGEIIGRKIKKMKGLSAQKIKNRLFGYLVRRGFSRGLIIEALIRKVGYEESDNE